jgi:hypothetical protein
MPAQNRARSDETVILDRIRQPSDQRGQDRPVRPIQSRPAVGPPQHGDLVAQHEQFGVFGRGRPGKQHEPAGKAGEDQIQPSSRSDTAHDHPPVTGWPSAQVTGPRRLLTPHTWDRRLFADDVALTRLELVESQQTGSGVIIATYRPVR